MAARCRSVARNRAFEEGSMTTVFAAGGYRYIPAVFQYSGGVAAEPGFTIQRYMTRPVFRASPQWADQMAEGLRQAGLPEH